MSVRVKLIASSLTALLTLLAMSAGGCFLLFWNSAAPYTGPRLGENLGMIAARYFPLALVLLLILTGVGALWILASSVKSLVRPLRRLRRAALEIRDGNLDYELVVSGRDEFAELGLCFEQMRVRLKRSTREKQAAEDERRAMLSSVCHDLKTPITSILGYAEGILDGVADTPEKTAQYAQIIRKKALSLQKLADDLLLLSHLENAQLPLDLTSCDLGALATEISEEFSGETAGAALSADAAPGLVCMIDREKLARVLLNLLQNSVKYNNGPAPRIELRVAAHGGHALLTVSDNGTGIPPAELGRVFERFYRVDASRGLVPGSGLGLAIARQIIHLHGGKIWIVNRPEGGLTVSVLLPLCGEPAQEKGGPT